VNMKNVVLRDVTPCGSCKNRRFGGSPILVALMMMAIRSSETVLTRAKRRSILEDDILHFLLYGFRAM
jgi:hypothetical protein